MEEETEEIIVFVNSEVFDHLLLPGVIASNFSLNTLQVIAEHLKGTQNEFDKEKFVEVCKLVSLPQDAATAVFILANNFFKSEPPGTLISEYLLFTLFIQLFEIDKRRLTRSSSVERISRELWPKADRGSSQRAAKSYEEEMHVKFYKRRLTEVWNLFLQDKENLSKVWNHAFKIKVGEKTVFLETLLNMNIEKDMPQVLVKNLRTTAEGVLSCIQSGKRLSWILGDIVKPKNQKAPKMVTNANQRKQRKLIVLNQLFDKTLGRKSSTLLNAQVKIHRCSNSYFYLLSPLYSISINKCSNTTIVTGPVQTVIRVQRCRNLRLVSLGRTVLVGETCDSSLYLRTVEKVVVDGGTCARISLNPYSANYTDLESDERGMGSVMKFDPSALILNQDAAGGKSRTESLISSSSTFQPFFIPFKDLNLAAEVPEVDQRTNTLSSWKSFLKLQSLTSEESDLVKEAVDAEFNSWLRLHSRELNGLKSFAEKI